MFIISYNGSSETGGFRAINSTEQHAVENLSFPSVPLASPSILALSLGHDDCKMAGSAPDITSSYNSIEGRRNFFLPERKKFSKTHHPGLFPFDLLGQNLVSLSTASTPLRQSLVKDNAIFMTAKPNLDLEGPTFLKCKLARH